MSESKEIKIKGQSFDEAINSIIQSGASLYDEFQKIHEVNEKLKEKWQGDGGSAFNLCSMVIEAQFARRINDIKKKTEDLQYAKKLMNTRDNELANQMRVHEAD